MEEFEHPERVAPDVFDDDEASVSRVPKNMFTPGERIVFVEGLIEKALVALREGDPAMAAHWLEYTKTPIGILKRDIARWEAQEK